MADELKVLLAAPEESWALVQVAERNGRPWVVAVNLRAQSVTTVPRSLASVLRNGNHLDVFEGDPTPYLDLVRRSWDKISATLQVRFRSLDAAVEHAAAMQQKQPASDGCA